MNYLLSKMICIQGQDRTLPFTNPRVKRQSGHYTLRAAEGAFRCRKGRPVQRPINPVPGKAFHEVEGRPTWELTMPATALAFPRGGGAHLRVQLINMKVLRCEQWGGFQRIAWAMSRLSTTILELAPSPAKNPNLQRAPSNRKGAPSGKALERSGRIGIGKHQRKPIKQKKGRLDADPTN